MTNKYQFDPTAYKRRLEREKNRPDLKERFALYEKIIDSQPTFDTEDEAVAFAVSKTRSGESYGVFVAPKELGGKWKAISWKSERGMAPDAADQLGWSMIYDEDMIYTKANRKIDNIKEI